METMFRGMTNDEWKNRDDLFDCAYLMKEWHKSDNDDENCVSVYRIEKNQMFGRSVATKSGYVIEYFMNGCGELLQFAEETDVFKVIEKARQLIEFIKL